MRNFRRDGLAVATIGFLTAVAGGCGKPGTTPAAALSEATQPAAEGLKLTDEILAKLKFHEVAERRLPRTLTVAGKVQFNEDNTAKVLTPVAGQVMNLRVRLGDLVRGNDLLFSLKSREATELMTNLLTNRRELEMAEKTLAMTKDLYEHQAASRISLQQAENEVAKEKTEVAQAIEALRLFGLAAPAPGAPADLNSLIEVRSPIAGTVVERNVTTGQFVQPESGELLTIANLETVWVLAEVFERDVRFVQPGIRGELTTTAYPDQKFQARVTRLHESVDPETRTVKVRFEVANPGLRLKPEMFASVALFLADSEQAITIPAAAAFAEDGRNYVYVRQGERLVKRLIEIASERDRELRLKSGLRSGDTVVADNVLLVRQLEHGGEAK
jgi:cobalt-zinc-cadmium efflux system membrane fusion protein